METDGRSFQVRLSHPAKSNGVPRLPHEHGRRARNGREVHANRPIRLAIRPEPGRHRRAARTERTQHALFLFSALTGTPTRSRIAKTLGDDTALGIERHTPPGRHAQIGFGTHDRTVSAS